MIETESFHSEAHFSPKSETEFENETERDCGIALWTILTQNEDLIMEYVKAR